MENAIAIILRMVDWIELWNSHVSQVIVRFLSQITRNLNLQYLGYKRILGVELKHILTNCLCLPPSLRLRSLSKIPFLLHCHFQCAGETQPSAALKVNISLNSGKMTTTVNSIPLIYYPLWTLFPMSIPSLMRLMSLKLKSC
jgi:hypothetical protein